MRVVVMGGSRFMGPAIVDRLLGSGHEVVVFNRGTRPLGRDGVEEVRGDRNDPDDLRQLADGPEIDAVVDMSAYERRQTSLLLDVLNDVPLWVHCSSGAVYEPQHTFPWTEETPYGPWSIWGQYGHEKLGCERELRDRRSGATTVALRLPYVLGPGNYAPREEFVLNRILDDAPVLLPGDGQALVQFVDIDQVAAATLGALNIAADAGWQVFNVAGRGAITSLRGFVAICADIAGVRPRVVTTHADPLIDGRFAPDQAFFPFPNEPYVLDLTLAEDHGLLSETVEVEDMIQRAYEHLTANPERRQWSPTPTESDLLADLASRPQ